MLAQCHVKLCNGDESSGEGGAILYVAIRAFLVCTFEEAGTPPNTWSGDSGVWNWKAAIWTDGKEHEA